MKINSELIRRERNSRFWSQDDLAAASGLSQRTIQRMEAEGECSRDSVRALAAALGIPAKQFLNTDLSAATSSLPYRNLQLGTQLIVVFAAIELGLLASLYFQRTPPSTFAWLSVALAIICVQFCVMRTEVDRNVIRFGFTFGLFNREFAIGDIVSFQLVKNKWWWGLGLRRIEKGWLYSVSGLDAVALHLQDGRQFRLGSDEVDSLFAAIVEAKESGLTIDQ